MILPNFRNILNSSRLSTCSSRFLIYRFFSSSATSATTGAAVSHACRNVGDCGVPGVGFQPVGLVGLHGAAFGFGGVEDQLCRFVEDKGGEFGGVGCPHPLGVNPATLQVSEDLPKTCSFVIDVRLVGYWYGEFFGNCHDKALEKPKVYEHVNCTQHRNSHEHVVALELRPIHLIEAFVSVVLVFKLQQSV